jgi:hypothetical protein
MRLYERGPHAPDERDGIRREGLPAGVPARDFTLRADSVPCAGQEHRSVRARLLGARNLAVAARSTRFGALAARSDVDGARRAPVRALAPKDS